MQTFILELKGNFFLRFPKANKPSLIYFVVRLKRKKIRLATGIKIYPQQWSQSAQRGVISNSFSKLDNQNNKIVNEKIESILLGFSEFKQYICNNPDKIEDISKLLNKFINGETIMENCIDYLFKTVEALKSVTASTKHDYNSTLKNLEKYSEEHPFKTFNDLNKKYVKGFYCYLGAIKENPRTKDGRLSRGYINKQIKQLKNILKQCAIENEVMDISVLKEWEDLTWLIKDKARTANNDIALRDHEILMLWKYRNTIPQNSATYQADKDIIATFLLECLTGQRFSDMENLTESLNTINKITTISLIQKKNSTPINCGIIFELTKTILKEYENHMPHSYTIDHTNKRLKVLAKAAGIKGKEITARQSGDEASITTETKERYEMVSTHTGRRTFITLLKLRGWDDARIQMYSGHKTQDMIQHYTKIKNSREYEYFESFLKDAPSSILRYVDESENEKLFGKKEENKRLTEEEFYTKEIEETKRVLAMFNAPAANYIECNDIDELRSMMYGIEHQLLEVLGTRDCIKEIFNDYNKSLKEKANDLHKLYTELKNSDIQR